MYSANTLEMESNMELLNKTAVRKYILAVARESRYHEFTQVSNMSYQKLDAHLRNYIRDQIERLPSVGKTVNLE